MKTLATILFGAVLFLPLTALATEIPGGPVYGHWYSSGNPYNINGNINVPVDSTLYIHEGVEVIFQGSYSFYVYGFLEAAGTEVDSVHFTGNTWSGITFENAPDSSHMFYCTVRYCTLVGLWCENSNPVISHCTVSHTSCFVAPIYVSDGGSPSLSHCTISDNYGGIYPGGISWYSGAGGTISDCIIRNNRSTKGGGVYINGGNVTLDNCTISDNRAETGAGGGVYCESCNPTFINCTITNNLAEWPSGPGGGVFCQQGSATFTNCTISNNVTYSAGGGVYCKYGSHTLTNCTIYGNQSWCSSSPFIGGGGICLDYASAVLSCCTIYDNITDAGGGGVTISSSGNLTVDHCTIDGNEVWSGQGSGIWLRGSSTANVTNSIISNNEYDYGIHNQGSLTVEYCDFYGNELGDISGNVPSGFGALDTVNYNGDSCDVYFNIFLDPVFVGLYNQDYNLRWCSPCIDAGDPNSPLDPDNTICDMGRFYFNQDVMGVVELYPHEEPIVIPPEGGQLVYDGWVFNFFGHPGRADIWTCAFVPGVGRYGPIDLYRNFRIPPDSIGMNDISQNVPGVAPAGDYVFVGYVGSYPSTIIDSSYFYFRKEGSVAGEIGDWSSSGLLMKAGDEIAFNLPSDYALCQNYPNPFNASTTISYQVPVDGHVKLEVYNTLGQRVATLVDSKQQAGYKSVIWDASDVSSGLYFYKLTAGDFTETRRMMLVK